MPFHRIISAGKGGGTIGPRRQATLIRLQAQRGGINQTTICVPISTTRSEGI
jgi:hypothetical protein